MTPIRILYLIDDLYSSRGGSEQHLLWLLNNIPAGPFEKHLIVFSSLWHPESVDFSKTELAGGPVVLGKLIGTGGKTWFKRVRFLSKYIREHGINLVQAFGPMGELAGWTALRWTAPCRSGRCRLIANRRDCGYDRRTKYRLIFRLTHYFGTKYIANSEAARRAAFENDRIPLNATTVIRNPVSRHRVMESLEHPIPRSELNIPDEARRGKLVGMVATVRPIKNYETLVRAARFVLEKIPDAWFLCIGEQQPSYLAELQKIAHENGVSERLIWYGGVDNPLRIVPEFDVAVLSSGSESFSNAVLEYAAAERAIVVSDVGGLSEIVQDGISGFLVPPKNPSALAEKIVQYLEDPDLRNRFGRAAKERIFRQYDEKTILDQYIDFYTETCLNG